MCFEGSQNMNTVTVTTVPRNSALQAFLPKADFWDAYKAVLIDTALTPTEIFLRAARATPGWVSTLMAIRNRAVRLFGAKRCGAPGRGDAKGRRELSGW
jgi:hypothetical protein